MKDDVFLGKIKTHRLFLVNREGSLNTKKEM